MLLLLVSRISACSSPLGSWVTRLLQRLREEMAIDLASVVFQHFASRPGEFFDDSIWDSCAFLLSASRISACSSPLGSWVTRLLQRLRKEMAICLGHVFGRDFRARHCWHSWHCWHRHCWHRHIGIGPIEPARARHAGMECNGVHGVLSE